MSPAERETRIAELATGYALDELDDAQLHEFHGYLSDPVAGSAAGRIAWGTLHTVTDLRAARSHTLQDSLRTRLASTPRPWLTARGLRWFIGGCVVLLALLASWWWWHRPQSLALLETVVGKVVADGRELHPGMYLDGQPLNIAEGNLATLRWRDGTRLTVSGPSTLMPQPAGAVFLDGHTEVTAAAAWTILLPDGQARAGNGSRLTIDVHAGRSCLGVISGPVADAADQPLFPGTCRIGNAVMSWTTTTWNQLPDTLLLPTAPCWNLNITTLEASGTLTLSWADVSLVCGAQDVALLRGDGTVVRAVRPPAGRCIELDAKPWAFTVSLQGESLLQSTHVPVAINTHSSGAVPLKAIFRCGPALPAKDVHQALP